MVKYPYHAQIPPVQQIRQSLCSVSLNDSLSSIQLTELVHVLGQLGDGLLEANVASVHDVDPVRLGVRDMLRHEATKAGEICGDGRDSHDGALRGGVAPWFVVGWEHAQVTATHKLLVVQTKERVRRGEELGVEYDLNPKYWWVESPYESTISYLNMHACCAYLDPVLHRVE